jgi:DNA polymerase (family 10)
MTELAKAQKLAERIASELNPFCHKIEIAGSIRRRRSLVGDIDLVVMLNDGNGFINRLKQNTKPIQIGKENLIVELQNGIQLDIFIARHTEKTLLETKPTNWGTLLLCRTGSKAHNIFLVNRAASLGMKWNPYHGLYQYNRLVACETEEEIFKGLDLQFIAPELREK